MDVNGIFLTFSWWMSWCCCSVAKPCPNFFVCLFFSLELLWLKLLIISVCGSYVMHGLQHIRLPCPLLSPEVYSNSCPLSQWCNLTIPSSTTLFTFCLQSFPASRSFPMSQLLPLGGQSTGALASASVLPVNI